MTTPDKMKRSSERARSWTGPALFTYGYRPFFLFGAIWSALAMLIWIGFLVGWVGLGSAFDPVSWHAHEMLFGTLGAVFAGFLLTAVPNWTGRLPIVGWPLAGLVSLWVIGRLSVLLLSGVQPITVAILDLVFPIALVVLIAREIKAGKNWKNLPVLALLVLFIVANTLFHVEASQGGYAASGLGFRLGLAVAVGFVTLIGGRIVPSFTRNWLAKQQIQPLPIPFGTYDKVTMGLTLVALVSWVSQPIHWVTGVACTIAGVVNIVRVSRWSGIRTFAEPLVWVLHAGYMIVPLGFAVVALSIWDAEIVAPVAAQHVWMAGLVGVMPLAVMTRASLGHAGLPLKAFPGVSVVYLLILTSVLTRFIAGFDGTPTWILHVSAFCWIAGFAGFAVLYWPILSKPRR